MYLQINKLENATSFQEKMVIRSYFDRKLVRKILAVKIVFGYLIES